MIFLIRMFWLMPRYRLMIGRYYDFDAQTAAEVVPVMQDRVGNFGSNERDFMRDSAIGFCEWNCGNYYYHSRDAFARSMIRNGLLEVID